MKMKAIFAIFAALLLSACASGPLIDPEVSSRMVVQEIAVTTPNLSGVSGRSISVPNNQVQSDISRALAARMQGRGMPGGNPVRVDVDVDRVSLVSPGQSLLIGGVSSVSATVSVVDLSTGGVLLPETKMTSSSDGWAPGGIVGAASRGSAQEDYRKTVASFANTVAQRLLGASAVSGTTAFSDSRSSSTTTAAGDNNALRPAAWKM